MVDLESVEELYEGEIELYRTSSIVCFHVARPEEREGRSTALRRNGSTLMPAQPTRKKSRIKPSTCQSARKLSRESRRGRLEKNRY